ncbi:MAG TPA: tetratricopeptide repeat protein [Candidatus Baltobacteraceae bacterium]|jgi:tetratricopeptide (TPR) repeat protein|nr:tetratricopeptide repeat protein [Candidatus Baltobacteraceae bacterium]
MRFRIELPTARCSRSFLIKSIAISTAVVVSIGLLSEGRAAEQNSIPAPTTISMNEETTTLNFKPRTIELISEKALRVREAIKRGDDVMAHRIIADVLAKSRVENWRFYPFSELITDISDVNDPAFVKRLNNWVNQNKNDSIPVLVRAQYYYDMGWFKRGDKYSDEIQAEHMDSFGDYMGKALVDTNASIRMSARNPYSFCLKLRILHVSGASQELMDAFKEAIAKYPGYYQLYDIVLEELEPKWGGAPIEKNLYEEAVDIVQEVLNPSTSRNPISMAAFVDQYAGKVGEKSPRKMLYLSLYRDLLDSASTACAEDRKDNDGMSRCVATFMGGVITPELESQVQVALHLYNHSDRHQFNVVIEKILIAMLKIPGVEAYSSAILEQAAKITHSDTRLHENILGHNNYVIDKAVAESWYMKNVYGNAIDKYKEALKDIGSAPFPNEEEKDVAISSIYTQLALVYSSDGRYQDAIAYGNVAVALGGNEDYENPLCYSYYKIGNYNESVHACTKLMEGIGDLEARFWRGRAYLHLGKNDAALRDFTVVADSEHDYRTTAAINMSFIYAASGNMKKSLNVLNKYTYLYDTDTQSNDDLAVSYNNRCYAYMQLGELKKALDDCNASLEYGSLPDAYSKQQELMKRLSRSRRK